jgi:hypothetical protein
MDRLAALLLEWEDRRARGEAATPDALCPDDPTLRAALAERIRLLERFEAFANPAAAPELPARVGKYEVRGLLGAGGMGVVYEARDPDLGRTVAVKVVRPDHAALAGPRALARFEREMRALGQLRGRANVVPVYHAETAPVPYLVMDHLPGGSLAAHRERLTAAGPREILPLVEAVARAVHAAHERGVLHRDLKPANILLDADGNPFVADFGLAALFAAGPDPGDPAGGPAGGSTDTRPDGPALTGTGWGGPGTPEYMAPEQHDPRAGRVGPATDVWALGVVLFELLAGRRPFEAASRADLAGAVAGAEAPPVPGAGRRLAAVVARCLAKDPARRYATAGELADALRRVRRPTRRAVLYGGLAAGLAAGAGAFGWLKDWWRDGELDGYTDPGAVRRALARLEKGEAVTLIDGGPPASYRLNLGPASGRPLARPDGWEVRTGPEYCVAELLPRLPPGEWVVEAVIRQPHPGPLGDVGIFAAGARDRAADGARQVLVFAMAVVFDGAVSQAAPRLVWVRETNTPQYAVNEVWYHQRFEIEPPADGVGRVSLEVGPRAVRAGLGGYDPFPECRADELEEGRRRVVDKRGPLPPGIVVRPHGGVGVYVKADTVWVGTFRVRPALGAPV